MGIRDNPPINLFNPQDIAKLPRLRIGIEHYRDMMKQRMERDVLVHGPIPILLRRFKHNRFSDNAFEWFTRSAESEQTTHLEAVEDEVWEATPFYNRQYPTYSQNIEELESVVGVMPDFDWIHEQLDDVHRWDFLRFVLEKSDVVAYLNSVEAEWSMERRHNKPLLVIPDKGVATYLKLAYG